MTYCLAMRLQEGLVFLSDTRTNAGVDNVGTYRKLHTFALDPQRTIVIQSAGNLATTQELLDRINKTMGGWPARPGGIEDAMKLVSDEITDSMTISGNEKKSGPRKS